MKPFERNVAGFIFSLLFGAALTILVGVAL